MTISDEDCYRALVYTGLVQGHLKLGLLQSLRGPAGRRSRANKLSDFFGSSHEIRSHRNKQRRILMGPEGFLMFPRLGVFTLDPLCPSGPRREGKKSTKEIRGPSR